MKRLTKRDRNKIIGIGAIVVICLIPILSYVNSLSVFNSVTIRNDALKVSVSNSVSKIRMSYGETRNFEWNDVSNTYNEETGQMLIEKDLSFTFSVYLYTFEGIFDYIDLKTYKTGYYFKAYGYDNYWLGTGQRNYLGTYKYSDVTLLKTPPWMNGKITINAYLEDYLEDSYELESGIFTPQQFKSELTYLYAKNGKTFDVADHRTIIRYGIAEDENLVPYAQSNEPIITNGVPTTEGVISSWLETNKPGVSSDMNVRTETVQNTANTINQGIINTESKQLGYTLGAGMTRYWDYMNIRSNYRNRLSFDYHDTWDSPSGIKVPGSIAVSTIKRNVGYSIENVGVYTDIDVTVRLQIFGNYKINENLKPEENIDIVADMGDVIFTPTIEGSEPELPDFQPNFWERLLEWFQNNWIWLVIGAIAIVAIILLAKFQSAITNLILIFKK